MLATLEQVPLLGAPLEGNWAVFRFLLGPWRSMVLVYAYEEEDDRALVVTIQDGRSSTTAGGPR